MGKSNKNAPVETKDDADQSPAELAGSDTEQTSTNARPDEPRARDIEEPAVVQVPDADNPFTDGLPEGAVTLGDTVVMDSIENAVSDAPAPEAAHTDVLVDDRTVLPLSRGRVVYYTAGADDRPFYGQGQMTAHVVEVYNDRSVNLLVAHPTQGDFQRRNNVLFRQPDDQVPDVSYAEWMPFQVAQAARS